MQILERICFARMIQLQQRRCSAARLQRPRWDLATDNQYSLGFPTNNVTRVGERVHEFSTSFVIGGIVGTDGVIENRRVLSLAGS